MALTFNLPSQIVVQTSAQWAADNTVYSAKRILVTSDANWDNTDQRKFKIADGTQTWSQLDYPPIGYETMTTSAGEFKFSKTTAGAVLLWTNGQDMRFSASVGGSPAFILKTDGTIVLENGTANKFLKTGASKEITLVDNPVDVNTIGSAINGATSATPNDTDLVMSVDTSVAKKNTWTQIKAFLKTYFDTVYKATFTENTAFNKNFGTGTTNIVEIGSTLGNSLITSTDANGKLQTLATSTYPSLTELSYVKGLSSAVQTQLNAKASSTDSRFGNNLQCFAAVTNLIASTTYYFGCNPTLTTSTATTGRVFSFMSTGTVTKVQLTITLTGTIGSNHSCNVYLRNITAGTETLLGSITYDQGANTTTSFLWTPSISIDNTTDFYSIKIVTGAFTTNPTSVYHNARIFLNT